MENFSISYLAQNFIIRPVATWKEIAADTQSYRTFFKQYAIPLIFLGAISAFLGGLFAETEETFKNAVLSGLATFIVAVLSLYFAAYLIYLTSGLFEISRDLDSIFKLVIFASTPEFLIQFVSNLDQSLAFIEILGLYAVYVFWTGVKPMLNCPDNTKFTFTITSYFIIFTIRIIFSLIFIKLFQYFGWTPA